MIQYQYPNGSRGYARPWPIEDCVQPAWTLIHRKTETRAEWAARLARVGVTPILVTPSDADPNRYDPGEPEETVDADGVILVTYPNPVAKVPAWSTATREVMYVSAGADVPPGYTAVEPPYGAYSVWDDAAGEWVEDVARQEAEAAARTRAELAVIDAATIRPLRAVLAAQHMGVDPDPADVAMLTDLETQALALRATLNTE